MLQDNMSHYQSDQTKWRYNESATMNPEAAEATEDHHQDCLLIRSCSQ